jgi:hypothetical protein
MHMHIKHGNPKENQEKAASKGAKGNLTLARERKFSDKRSQRKAKFCDLDRRAVRCSSVCEQITKNRSLKSLKKKAIL